MRENINNSQPNRIEEYCNSLLERNISAGLYSAIESEVLSEFQDDDRHNPEVNLKTLKLMALYALRDMFQKRVALSEAMSSDQYHVVRAVAAPTSLVQEVDQKITTFTQQKAYECLEAAALALGISKFYIDGDVKMALFDPNEPGPKGDFLRSFAQFVADTYSRCIGNIIHINEQIDESLSLLSSGINQFSQQNGINKKQFEEKIRVYGYYFADAEIKKLNIGRLEQLDEKKNNQPFLEKLLEERGQRKSRCGTFCEMVRNAFGCKRRAGRAHGD